MKLQRHILAALRGIASEKWHGRGCRKKNCGSTCLCTPCHARVALEKIGAGEGNRTLNIQLGRLELYR